MIYRQNTSIEKMYVYASELSKFWHFYILKLFLSIFCRFIRYFVGTNGMLVGLHVPTNFQMYRQKSEKALLGGGGGGGGGGMATLMTIKYPLHYELIMELCFIH